MLTVLLEVSQDGLLRRFEASGHAGADAGRNIACAAATVLLRTAGRECTARGIVTAGGSGARGEMAMVVAAGAGDAWLKGVTDFLVRGMSDLAREYPDQIAFRVEMTEVVHGTEEGRSSEKRP